MTADYALCGYQKATDKRIRIYALPVSLVLGILLLFASLGASAQDEIDAYRVEAALRLEAEIQRLEAQTANAQVLAGLAHTKFFLAGVTTDRNSALTHYQSGLNHANQAMKLQKNNHTAQLWGLVNTLKIFEITKPFRALWMMDDLEANLLGLKRFDEKFEYAAPDRVLAILYAESPGWLIGSSAKAEGHFKAALRIAPEFPANRLLYADFMLDQNRADDARALISEWATQNKMSDFPLYEMIWRMDLEKIRRRLAE